MKKRIIIFLVFLISGLIINYSVENNSFKHITTDSGFDVDYNRGSSSSSSSSSWDDDKSSSRDNERYSKDDDRYSNNNNYSSSNENNYTYSYGGKSEYSPEEIEKYKRSERRKEILGYIFVAFCLIIVSYTMYRLFKNSKKRNSNTIKYSNYNKNNYTYTTDERWPKDPNDKKLLEDAYNIFIGVQNAWMNFDYNKLRELVTDDLYNMYYNQLQTLSIKGEKNIMENFELKDSYIYSKSFNKEKNINYYYIRIKVSFYDYIVDSNNRVVRGKKDIKVNMEYELTFIKNESNNDTCPVCGAKIENGITTCPYCRSRIQGVSSKMKLSKKKVIRQW